MPRHRKTMGFARLRQSSWIVTAPLTLGALVYLACVWLPGAWGIEAMENDLAYMQRFVERTAAKQLAVAESLTELEQARAVAARWEKASPKKQDLSAVYQKINILAQNAGMTIQRLDPMPSIAYERLYEAPVALVGSGSFGQIYDFLRGLEGLQTPIWIKSVKLGKTLSNDKEIRCQMELVIFANKST